MIIMTTTISKQTCQALLRSSRARPRALSSTARPSAPSFTSSPSRSFASPAEEAPPRPFRVLGLQQIAIGSLDKSPLSNLWINVFGVPRIGTYRSEKENVDEDILLLGKPGSPHAVELDIMMPIDPTKSPKVHVPPLNHIGLWVDDLPAAVAWMEGRGVRFTPGGIRKGASGHDVTFIHPKGNEESPIGGEDVLIELVQAPEEVIVAMT
jgi:lactoylglutathione lyase